jgi:hypothetical protein
MGNATSCEEIVHRLDAPPPCEHGEFGYCADCEWDAHEERGPMDLEDELEELLA